jgi:hypothetical protein
MVLKKRKTFELPERVANGTKKKAFKELKLAFI